MLPIVSGRPSPPSEYFEKFCSIGSIEGRVGWGGQEKKKGVLQFSFILLGYIDDVKIIHTRVVSLLFSAYLNFGP